MAIVLDKSHRWRVVAAHVFLLCLCAVVIFPFLMILSIFGNSIPNLILIIAVLTSTRFFRISRAAALNVASLDFVEAAKAANPSEAAPKVGPNAPPKDAQAVLSTLPDSGASIHPRDKADLGTALSKWKKGSLDDKQLELEVARVFMRTYGKKLEGQALNKAVAAWVAALKQSKQTTVAQEGK